MSHQNRYHVIKDPVHGTMQFTDIEDKWVKPFINSPHFQRLRHIKQLGMGDYIFPGSVHTRFNHSIGCCYVGRQVGHKIGLADEERQLTMIACLLHDLGHGPFSHTFEDLFQQKLIRHEDWTPFFLADYRSEIFFEDYNRHNPRYTLTEAKFSQVEAMIMHKPMAKRVLADIVSSQLDADRLDYLLRDSHFCGVAYGHYDFPWLLHCLAIVDSGQGERLGITYKGIGAVEHYLMARRLMIRNIYYSYKKLALEYLLVRLLSQLASVIDQAPYAELKKTRLGILLDRVNAFNLALAGTTVSKTLKQDFLRDCYPLYKELCDYDVLALIKQLAEGNDDSIITAIAKRLHHRQIPKIVGLDGVDMVELETRIREFKVKNKIRIEDWQLAVIKTPHQSYTAEGDPILVLNEYGQAKPLDEISLMIHAISDKYEQAGFLCIDRAIMADKSVEALVKSISAQGLKAGIVL